MGQIVMVSIVYLQFSHHESCYNQLQFENIFYLIIHFYIHPAFMLHNLRLFGDELLRLSFFVL